MAEKYRKRPALPLDFSDSYHKIGNGLLYTDLTLLRFSGLGLPAGVLLDRQGRAVRTYAGPIFPATLSADVARLLFESPAK